MVDNRKKMIIGLIIDGTLSFTRVYPQIFYFIEHLFLNLQEKKEADDTLLFGYQVTEIHDELETMTFSNHMPMTTDAQEVIDKLSEMTFYGGSEDGFEKLTEAVGHQLCQMRNYGPDEENTKRCILMFTDSMPSDGNLFPDFISNQVTSEEKGLSAAYIFACDDEYMPVIQMVNQRGMITENQENVCVYGSLSEVLEMDEEATLRYVEKMAKDIVATI